MSDQLNQPPFPNSYWVLQDKFLAGPYPGSRFFDEEAREKLDKLLAAGITLFIDLTQPGELQPYEAILYSQAASRGINAIHLRFPIQDFNCPSSSEMQNILDTIDAALMEEKAIYLHCWGGIGRTGTVVGCYFVRHGKMGEKALELIVHLREDIVDAFRRSPESDEQCEMVLNWHEAG
jgi:protein-tyrosine phosphatase